MHPQELSYYNSLIFDKRKRSYLIGRYAAKRAIAALTHERNLQNILIQHGIFNQPIVTYRDLHNVQVSITHCDEIGAAIVFSEAHPMGLDIERINTDKEVLIESQLTEAERKFVKTILCPYDILLPLLWAAKEALSKILKTGLVTPFILFELSTIESQKEFFVGYFKNFAQFKALLFNFDDYVCSIVYPKKMEMGVDLKAMQGWVRSAFGPSAVFGS